MNPKKGILLLLAPFLLVAWLSVKSEPPNRNYLDSLRPFWREIYPDGGETLYCGQQFRPFDRQVNVEHVYPMSWVTRKLKCGKREQCRHRSNRFNLIESDMHNLYPALKEINQARGSMPFAEIPGEKRYRKGCDFEVDFRKHRVEPRPEARGRIARAMLYMADEYGLDLYKRQRKLLEKWNRQYPPDEEERRHNRAVKRIQGKGNPYIH
jgi:deoxyribonuclease-1